MAVPLGLRSADHMPAAQNPALSGLLVKCWSGLKSLRTIAQVFLPEQDDITSWIKKKKK